MTTILALIYAFLWNIIGAAVGIIPFGILFISEFLIKKFGLWLQDLWHLFPKIK